MISLLEAEYGIPKRREETDPLDTLIRTILSQNTSDRNRDMAYRSLKKAYPTWDAVLEGDEASLSRVIKVGGLGSIKARRIIRILEGLKRTYGRLSLEFLKDLSLEEPEDLLRSFDGVGEKTAKCVLLFGLGRDVFPVDTHIFRVAKRLGMIPYGANRQRAHEILGKEVPANKMYALHLNLIEHGRKVCKSRSPQCPECCLRELCMFNKTSQIGSTSGISKGL